jgi:Spy/CpxP family protein refolding chaperone
MKKLLIMTLLTALALTASFVSADPMTAIRPPIDAQQMWKCQCEDQAKLDKAFKACEAEAAKHLDTMYDKKPRPSRSFLANVP